MSASFPRATLKLVVFLMLSLVFVAGGAWMLREGEAWGWLPLAFFGLGAIVFLTLMFGDYGLSADEAGFEMRTLWRRKRYRWEDVSEFSVLRVQGSAQIMFDDLTVLERPFARLFRTLLGRNASIPAIIVGGSLEEACARLNALRAQALAGRR